MSVRLQTLGNERQSPHGKTMTTDPQIVTPTIDEPEFTAEQIAQDISASHDSVQLINQIVGDDQHSDDIHNTVMRNVSHLRSCLTLPRIMNNATTEDKIAFANAATLGENWV